MKTSDVDSKGKFSQSIETDVARPAPKRNLPSSGQVQGLTDQLDKHSLEGSNPADALAGLPPPSSSMLSSRSVKHAEDVNSSIDAEKMILIDKVRASKTMTVAIEAADRIAELHGKPRHADEVHAMADRLVSSEKERQLVKLAASLVVLGEWKSPAKVMLGGRLSDNEKRAHIFPINSRAVEILEAVGGADAAAVAAAIDGKESTGVTPWFHACRDISAMDAPRRWREDENHPDGRLNMDEIALELEKNSSRPGRRIDVTAEMLSKYRSFRMG